MDQYNRPIQKSDLEMDQYNRLTQKSDLEMDQYNRPIQKSDLEMDRYNRPIQKSDLEMDQYNRPIQKSELKIYRLCRPIQSEDRIGIGRSDNRTFRPPLPKILLLSPPPPSIDYFGGVTGRPKTMCPRMNVLGPLVPKSIVPCDTMSLD